MIIGISGKIGSGKDTAAKMFQHLYYCATNPWPATYRDYLYNEDAFYKSPLEIKKFATKLKQIISLLTGIPVEDLEKEEVKARVLGEEWTRYGKADGFWYHSSDDPSRKLMDNVQCSKEEYEAELRTNWQTAYKQEFTPRLLLQYIGTDLFRSKINTDIWVNALFADYNPLYTMKEIDRSTMARTEVDHLVHPTWIISDVRFPNEVEAIKDRGGIVVRINRPPYERFKSNNPNLNHREAEEMDNESLQAASDYYDRTVTKTPPHISETALDDYEFDHVIDNNGTLEELYEKLKSLNLFTNGSI